jgi:hypothetical protein
MKNEFAKIQAIGMAVTLVVLLNVVHLLLAPDDDLDPTVFLAVFIARVTFIFAVFLIWSGRFRRRVAFVFPAPSSDLQLLLSKLSSAFGDFGYHAVDTSTADHWSFEAQAITPAGKPVNRSSAPRTVSVEATEPGLLRVVGSSALLRQIRKQFPGTARVPYEGPQPWIARGRTVLGLSVAVVFVFGACISYVAPVIRSMQLARRHTLVPAATDRAGQHRAYPNAYPKR